MLPSRLFSEQDLPLVQGFTCCRNPAQEERWEKDINDWIKSPAGQGGAIDAVSLGQARVWLYLDRASNLIGFTSLGYENIELSSGESTPIYLVPYVGIAAAFQGTPKHPREARFARRILLGLIEEAKRQHEFRELYLYVDFENPARTKFYPDFGFTEFDQFSEDGRTWIMLRKDLSQ